MRRSRLVTLISRFAVSVSNNGPAADGGSAPTPKHRSSAFVEAMYSTHVYSINKLDHTVHSIHQ